MAPDINSVPPSPRYATTAQSAHGGASSAQPASRHSSTPVSRRASQIYPMSPPPLPLASPGGVVPPSAQQSAFPPLSPSLTGHVPSVDAAGVPMRHPRPLTAAELHLELEKEQEAVVNRLTRELSALRAHSASVASTASSTTSGVLLEATDHSTAHTGALTGPTHPTSARRHRSSSSVSRGSMSAPYTGPTTFSTGLPLNAATVNIPHTHHRYSLSSQPGTYDPSGVQQARSASVVSTPRYEEVAHYKWELEEAKRENEQLKRRIRELERMIKGESDTPRGRRGAPPQSNGDSASNVTPTEPNASQ
ncbi:hypothetical protein CC78DRAFT_576581 [Lojkania enalia]|uniref:Uncharacterized protein n=1 Tax=Lojkania enalia TaxID=147567 RepID=A0A9P4N833_9PLEO|nr:hypothetical protein CC78DRAFT_576581 [Didymosphaeria enalia]